MEDSSTNFEGDAEDEWVFEDSFTEIFLIFPMMNENLHLTSLFHVKQNCETALFIWNILMISLTHFWKLKTVNI